MCEDCYKKIKNIKNSLKSKNSFKNDFTKRATKTSMQSQHPFLHRLEAIKYITALVDNKPPRLELPFLKLDDDYYRLEGIMKENVALLGRLNDIARSRSAYYDRNHISNFNSNASWYWYRLQELEKIDRANLTLNKRLCNVSGKIPTTKEMNKMWQNTISTIEIKCHHELVLPGLLQKQSMLNVAKNHPMVYLDVGVKNYRILGRLVIMLYLDLAPIAVKNFIDLCENHRNWPNPNVKNLDDKRNVECSCFQNDSEEQEEEIENNYEYISKDCQLIGTQFTRIFPNLLIYAGNLNYDNKIPNFHGIPDYQPEKMIFHHGYKGTLSMCPMENGLINSEFTISLKPLRVLDGERLAFGRVIRGLSILDTISNYGTKNGKPQKLVEIFDCGILNLNLE